jgi:hypothetical protein
MFEDVQNKLRSLKAIPEGTFQNALIIVTAIVITTIIALLSSTVTWITYVC